MDTLLRGRRETPIGRLTFWTRGEALAAVAFEGSEPSMERWVARTLGPASVADDADPGGWGTRLDRYFAGDMLAFAEAPLAMHGTSFQRSVWTALLEIPAGTTVSYGELARRAGRADAVRAVGAANGANPLPVVVPCHRAVAADGSLHGYGGGLERKRWLLEHEARHAGAQRGLFPSR